MITVHDNNVTEVEVKRVTLERPRKAGRFWRGIQHSEFLEVLQAILDARKWKIVNQAYSVSKNETGLAAAFDLKIPGMKAPTGTNFALGVLHDNNRKRALTLVCGATVAVCNNGMASGQLILKHKHISGFNLRDEMESAMDRYLDRIGLLEEFIAQWKQFRITGPQSDQLLMNAARLKILPPTRIFEVDQEFRNPSFNYKQDYIDTSFGLYNAFTHVMKKAPARFQLDRMEKFRDLLPTTKRGRHLINVDGNTIKNI